MVNLQDFPLVAPYGLRHENSPEKECGGKRIGIKGKITGINCDRRDA